MLAIIVGIFFAILWWYLEKKDEDSIISLFVRIAAPGACILCIVHGVFIPTGYQNPVLTQEIELVSLSSELDYVSISDNNIYTYKYEVEDSKKLKDKSYKLAKVSGNVTVVEMEKCEKPILKVYERKAKITLISFGLGSKKTEYVFYVPIGTIQREFELN